jgi:Adenylate and Guanylate cyclase catalytic domain
VRESDDFFGHAVNYAARIASAAAGGEIVTSALVHGLLDGTGGFTFEPPRAVELKGISGEQLSTPSPGRRSQWMASALTRRGWMRPITRVSCACRSWG